MAHGSTYWHVIATTAMGFHVIGCRWHLDSTAMVVRTHTSENGTDQKVRFVGKGQHMEAHTRISMGKPLATAL